MLAGTSLKTELRRESLPLFHFAHGQSSFIQSSWRLKGDGNLIVQALTEGIKANTPYILYFTGEPQNVRIIAESTIKAGQSKLTFSSNGYTVTLNGADKIMSGDNIYGIFAKDNADDISTYLQFLKKTTGTFIRPAAKYLIKNGFINRTPKGRVATDFAYDHFNIKKA